MSEKTERITERVKKSFKYGLLGVLAGAASGAFIGWIIEGEEDPEVTFGDRTITADETERFTKELLGYPEVAAQKEISKGTVEAVYGEACIDYLSLLAVDEVPLEIGNFINLVDNTDITSNCDFETGDFEKLLEDFDWYWQQEKYVASVNYEAGFDTLRDLEQQKQDDQNSVPVRTAMGYGVLALGLTGAIIGASRRPY